MFLLITLSNRDVFIYHLATLRAKADRGVFAAVIKVGAIIFPGQHFPSLSIDALKCSRASVSGYLNVIIPLLLKPG
jgi:hypothetical protein